MKKPPPAPLRIEVRDDRVAVLVVDVPGERMNVLKEGFEQHFSEALQKLDRIHPLEGVVLASGKKDDFMAGADVKLLSTITTAAEGRELSARAQAATHLLEAFRVPIVAAIHGNCLGGGLELSLACHGRVVSDSPRTKLGLPEVKLGLIPGAGGTQRLPRLVGITAALDMILTGRTVGAKRAKDLGLVDEVVPAAILVDKAAALARKLFKQEGGAGRPAPKRGLLQSLGNLAGKLVYSQARKSVMEKTHGNFPAPLKAIEAVQEGIENDIHHGYSVEADLFGELSVTREARNLMRVFFGVTELKKDSGVSSPKVKARPVRKVGMLGAGLMGSGISYVTAANAGHPVRFKDISHETLRRGLGAIRKICTGRVERRRMTAFGRDRLMSMIHPTTDYSGFRSADVVIEAVIEDLKLKRDVLRQVEKVCGPDTIFASNTSSIPIGRIAAASRRPDRVIGMHYFSPVEKMPLLEVIESRRTAAWVTATCVALGKRQGKTVIVVGDGPGFYTTRILGPYINEAGHLVAEGAPIGKVDRALMTFGFPVGPLKLLDEVGIDTAVKISHVLNDAFGERMSASPALERMVEKGRKGRKSGSGFYTYRGTRRSPDGSVYDLLGARSGEGPPDDEIVDRCLLPLVSEAVRCLEEGILRSQRDGDVGAVMGLGFPPFLAGPFRYVEERGAGEIVARMDDLRRRFGERFTPAPLLVRMAKDGAGFEEATRRRKSRKARR